MASMPCSAPRSVGFAVPSEIDEVDFGQVSVVNTFLHVSSPKIASCLSRTAPELPPAESLMEAETRQFPDEEESEDELPEMMHTQTYDSYEAETRQFPDEEESDDDLPDMTHTKTYDPYDFDPRASFSTVDDDSQLSSLPSANLSRASLEGLCQLSSTSLPNIDSPELSCGDTRRKGKSRSVRFTLPTDEDQSQEVEVVSVVNTFVHVERRERSMKQRCRTTPERVLEAAADELGQHEDSVNVEDDSDDESGPLMVAVKTHDPFEEATACNAEPQPNRCASAPLPFCGTPPVAQYPAMGGIAAAPVVTPALVPLSTLSMKHVSLAACVLPGMQSLLLPIQSVAESPEAGLPRLLGRATESAQESQPDAVAPAKPKASCAKLKAAPPNVPIVSSGSPRASEESGKECLKWNLDGRKLESNDKSIMSPAFDIDIAGLGATSFRLMALPRETKGKGQRGFVKACGHSRLFVKSEVSLPAGAPELEFRVTVALGTSKELSRRSKRHQFADASLCPLQDDANKEVWDLMSCMDSSKRVIVVLQVVEPAE